MSEIGSLYIRARIYPKIFRNVAFSTVEEIIKFDDVTKEAFDSEKQLALFKILMEQDDFSWSLMSNKNGTYYAFYIGYENSSNGFKEFPEAIAAIINNYWDYFREWEIKKIKEILSK